MDRGGCHCSGELEVLQQDQNLSQTTICLPSSSPAKPVSTYLPQGGYRGLEDSNPDPFYLEKSLAATPTDDSYTPAICDERFGADNSQYYTVDHQKTSSKYTGPDRSTLAQLELENSLIFHRYTSSRDERNTLHSSQDSFSSVQTVSTTPDLTPSSSFSSTYSQSSTSCPDAVLKATEKLYHHAQQAQLESQRPSHLPASNPPKYSLPPPPPIAALTPAHTRPTTPAEPATLNTMRYETSSMSSSSRRRRQAHPTLPNLSRGPSCHSSRRKQSSPGTRPYVDASMISPPSLINPVTMEPHATHFDQALFIPANDYPSPMPSPVGSSPPISRQMTRTSMERPSMSTMDAHGEQSVWESDSDNESISHKSLSRKPIDTLRKVRSKAKLRAAKSQPRLHQTMLDDQVSEKFPCLPDDAIGEPVPDALRSASLDRPSTSRPSTSRDGLRPHPLQTLRLVAPSTTSLLKARSRQNSSGNDSDIDWSAAAAFQAKTRRKRSNTPEFAKSDKERLTSLCFEQHSEATFQEAVAEEPKPLMRRMLESLRFLNCARTKKTNIPTPM
ncbi:hypothetical protein N7468_009350 [Penicillium chermesinum]|uniref:Uncharacterized protein n=1 Tax=Penicillium chermesinum TaxID=63820 RepID=A0A9W9TEW5_9EURO|nr:uncharacterized protein N7468_009350 [Penicillium chermesinum]KAJ5220146.1 hypothetical protein N7468_009350 [Penicillium chermesinum]KAJ6157595.1 hypothetical protein N7470_005187 [Penicillium chermesinum]